MLQEAVTTVGYVTSLQPTGSVVSTSSDDLINAYIRDTILEVINCYLLPVVFLIGVFGNVSSLMVLVCLMKKSSSTTIVLTGLTLADLGYLVTTAMRKSSCLASKIDPVRGLWPDTLFLPQVYMLNRVFGLVTAFLTMVISVERWLAVYFPFKIGLIVNKFRMKVCVLIVYTTSLMLIGPFFFTYETVWVEAPGTRMQIPRVRETEFFKANREKLVLYNNVVLSNILVLLPLAVVSVCSVMIILSLGASLRWRRSLQSENRSNQDHIIEEHSSTISISERSIICTRQIKHSPVVCSAKLQRQNCRKPKSLSKTKTSLDNIKMTRTLIFVAVNYAVCNVPASASTLANLFEPQYASLAGRYTNTFTVVSGMNILLQCINSSSNFLIYVANSSRMGATFRRFLHL